MNAQRVKNWLEWTVFVLGLVLTGSMVSYLAYAAWTEQSGPPRLSVELGAAWSEGDHYVVPVWVKNSGQQTAEQVQVEVELTAADGSKETASFQIPFVPRDATRQGSVTFTTDPNSADCLTARAVGFQRP